MSPALLLAIFDSDSDQLHALAQAWPAAAAPAIGFFLFLAVGAIALFTFLSVATWTGTRYAEREAYYRAEMMKKIAEAGGDTNPALDYLREQERIAAARRLGGYRMAGLINIGAGLGVMALLGALLNDKALCLVGAIPLLVGVAMLAHATWFAPEREAAALRPVTTRRE